MDNTIENKTESFRNELDRLPAVVTFEELLAELEAEKIARSVNQQASEQPKSTDECRCASEAVHPPRVEGLGRTERVPWVGAYRDRLLFWARSSG